MTITVTLKYWEIHDFVKVLTTTGSMEDSEVEFPKGILVRLLYDIQNLGLVYTRVKNIHFSSPFILKINTNIWVMYPGLKSFITYKAQTWIGMKM